MDLDRALSWAAGHTQAALVTIRRDGQPQSSDISYFLSYGVFRISVTDDRAKTVNMRRDPRAVLHLSDRPSWSYLSFDGTVELSPVTTEPGDPTSDELVEYLRRRVRQAPPRLGRVPACDGERPAPGRTVHSDLRGWPNPLTGRSCLVECDERGAMYSAP